MATRTQTAKRTRKTQSKGAYAHRIQRLHSSEPRSGVMCPFGSANSASR